MIDFIWSVLGFVLVIGILVTIHEAGHFFVARYFNIKVLTFSIGFGKTLWSRTHGETEYRIALLPLGGFVKFVDERDEEQDIAPEDRERAFNRQPLYQRFLVVLAGPLVNLAFAWLAFSLMYWSGINGLKPLFSMAPETTFIQQQNSLVSAGEVFELKTINERPVQTWQMAHQAILQALVRKETSLSLGYESEGRIYQSVHSLEKLDINQPDQNWIALLGLQPERPNVPAIIGQVVEKGPARLAGLEVGDKVLSINGQVIESWRDLVAIVRSSPDQTSLFVIERAGAQYSIVVKLSSVLLEGGTKQGRLGAAVYFDSESLKPFINEVTYDFDSAMKKAVEHSQNLIEMTLRMLNRMLFGEVSITHLSGPISIAEFSGKAIQSDWVGFLSFIGLISLSLGILNLLPIPMLDGGHLFFYMLEAIKGTPVSETVQVAAQKVGIFLLLSLTFIAIYNDVVRITNG